jgi:GTP cyclohydrolase I
MNAPDRSFLADVQSLPDSRDVLIERVGIRGLRHPVVVQARRGPLHTVADMELTVLLAPGVKGTHMSRFIEAVQSWTDPITPAGLAALGCEMIDRLDARAGRIALSFPYFIRKSAPVSGVQSLLDYQAGIRVALREGAPPVVSLSLVAPVTSLCPCSKEISEYGAHNQRSHVSLLVELRHHRAELDFEALAGIAEQAASCELYGLLKRPDEKFVTERAYDNPRFVEDLVRDVALALAAHPGVRAYEVEVENFESIHNHSAYARVTGSN